MSSNEVDVVVPNISVTDIETGIRKAVVDRNEKDDVVNPFAHRDNMTLYEWFKTILGIVIVPTRLILMAIVLLGMAFFAKLSISFGFDSSKPMSNTRRVLFHAPLWMLARVFLFIAGFYYLPIKGKRASSDVSLVNVAAPHSSALDAFLLLYGCRSSSAVAKFETSKIPLLGYISTALQTIYVKRELKDARAQVLEEIQSRVKAGNWRHLVIFPEGTTTNRKSLITFKHGAFAAGSPVQPILMRFPFKFFDPAWTAGGPSRGKMVLRLLCQFYTPCNIEYLPVYYPSEEEKADSNLYANNVRKLMAEALGVGTTEHSYEDMFLAKLARKQNLLPGEILPFEFSELRKLYDLNLKDAKSLLRRFAKETRGKKNAEINVYQFSRIIGLPVTESVVELFDYLDVEGYGKIDFASVLVGFAFISKNISAVEGAELLFDKACGDSEHVTISSLYKELKKLFKDLDQKSLQPLFNQADPERKGRVTKEEFKAFIESHPELVYLRLNMENKFESQKRPLSILSKKRVEKLVHSKKNSSEK